MSNINYNDLKIAHIIIFNQGTTFACCRENSHGRVRLFLIAEPGNVYARNGRNERWEAVEGDRTRYIRNYIEQGVREGVPVYRLNSPFQAAV